MVVEVNTNNTTVDWNTRDGNRILQNVTNLLKTIKYEVAYLRDLGISSELIDKPLGKIEGEITSEIIELISTYEPRASVVEVEIIGVDADGNLNAKVAVEI